MKIAIVAPSPVPFTIGGSELLFFSMQRSINMLTSHQCELIKLPSKETNFWEIIDSYYKFYTLDLSHFDLVISSKYPSWMVQHKNHRIYMIHHLRGLFDTYSLFNEPYEISTDICTEIVKEIHEICLKKDYSKENTDKLFSLLFQLKSEQVNYPKSLFKFPGPFIREIIHYLDTFALLPQNITQYYSMSKNVLMRSDYFPANVKVKIIYPPSSIEKFRCTGYNYIFTASRLDSPKRIDRIIESMKYVPHDVKLKIAGTGPEYQKLKNLIIGDPRIELLGYVSEDHLVELYAAALGIVFIPYDEDYGLITLEGMMSRKPIITATDSGGPLEFVINDKTGFIVDPIPEKIAEKINILVENKDIAIRLGDEAYNRVKNISWDHFVFELLGETTIYNIHRKKILVLSTYSCYPPRGGGQQRLYNIYSRLAKKFDVKICSITESNKSYDNLLLENGLQQICIPQSLEHAQLQWTEEKKLGKNLYDCCMIDLVEKSPQYIDEVKKLMTESDIIVFSHPYLFPLAKFITPHLKVIYEAHNVEYLLKKVYVNNNCWDVKLFSNEKNCCDFANLIFTTSEEDKTNLRGIYNINPDKIAIAPNGVDTQQIRYISTNEKIEQKRQCNLKDSYTILFVGSWHPPNLEALKFIINDLLPRLDNTKLLLVGSIKDYYLSEVGKLPKNVLAFGVVEECEKYEIYKLADIAINPMFSGSGTNLKMLDYFSAGIPVISTETGARGLSIEHNKEAIICSPDTMLQSIQQLMHDQTLQNTLRKNARTLVESTYSWNWIVKDIENHIEEI